jgi:hypothetical protein
LAVGGLCDGNETSYSEYFQWINVSQHSAEIDAGNVEVSYSGYLSDYSGSDRPAFYLAFLNGSGVEISSSAVLSTLNSNWTNLSNTQLIPTSTRAIKAVITGTRNAGTDNDSYFDDLNVRLNFTPGDNCSQVLPVALTRFSGSCIDNHPTLYWEAADEKNISAYQIERSFDGIKWVVTGTETPMNNQQSLARYTHESWENIFGRTAYYRLHVFDSDGTSAYSPVVSIHCSILTPVINIFPNPVVENYFKLFIDNPDKAPVTIEVKNMFGQSVFQQETLLDVGEHQLLVEGINWPSGIYSITISTKDWYWSEKLVRD